MLSGTSVAAPVVTGAAVLLISAIKQQHADVLKRMEIAEMSSSNDVLKNAVVNDGGSESAGKPKRASDKFKAAVIPTTSSVPVSSSTPQSPFTSTSTQLQLELSRLSRLLRNPILIKQALMATARPIIATSHLKAQPVSMNSKSASFSSSPASPSSTSSLPSSSDVSSSEYAHSMLMSTSHFAFDSASPLPAPPPLPTSWLGTANVFEQGVWLCDHAILGMVFLLNHLCGALCFAVGQN